MDYFLLSSLPTTYAGTSLNLSKLRSYFGVSVCASLDSSFFVSDSLLFLNTISNFSFIYLLTNFFCFSVVKSHSGRIIPLINSSNFGSSS